MLPSQVIVTVEVVRVTDVGQKVCLECLRRMRRGLTQACQSTLCVFESVGTIARCLRDPGQAGQASCGLLGGDLRVLQDSIEYAHGIRNLAEFRHGCRMTAGEFAP